MRLTELNPEWSEGKKYLRFGCPNCRSVNAGRLDIQVAPVDGDDRHWHMTGDNFENVTLSPSIDFRHYNPGKPVSTDPMDSTNCRAHFFIRNGEIQFA